MSMKAFQWAKEQTVRPDGERAGQALTSAEKFVLVMIADRYNETWGRAWPSFSRLASDTNLSLATIKRVIPELREAHLVIVEPWVVNSGAGRMSHRYLLPAYRPEVCLALEQPVVASPVSAGADDSAELLRVPGTNLVVDRAVMHGLAFATRSRSPSIRADLVGSS